MQTITPLTINDFKEKSNVIIGKAEIDSNGAGNYLALPDITDFSINTNIANKIARICSYGFNIKVLNTDDQFNPTKADSPYYGYLKQGRRIKLYTGVKKNGTEYYYQWLIGRVDGFRTSEVAGRNIRTISGRDFLRVVTDYKLYSPDTYWGTTTTLNTVAGQVRYDLPAACKGVYIAYLDSTSPYDGSNLEEIYIGTDFAYDWNTNQFCFASQRIPDFAGTNNLKIYYMTVQTIENVVGHILYLAGIFATTGERDTWIANASYVTPTGETIDRVWFNTGTSALEAIRLLSEVVQYRFYFDFEGNAIFKPKASAGTVIDTLYKSDIEVKNIEQNNNETFTHIIVTGETRDRILGDDETAPSIPTSLNLTTGFGESNQAGLAWIKATWDINTEIDFGHYELRIKKNADTVYTEVSTVTNSYIFYGLESGVTYNVQIRACDIYENRSAWSSAQNQVTATDSSTPAKIAGETATAILAGIKVEWTKGSEDNIAFYKVERQESPDNIDWTGGWVEKVRISGDMWLDLLLTYSKYYRYRITAYTVAGVVGITSDFTTAVQPNQAGANDIVANCITADQIAGNTITANEIEADTITGDEIEGDSLSAIFADLGTIIAGNITINSSGFIRSEGKDTYADATAGFWLGYDSTAYKFNLGSSTNWLKWTGSALQIKGRLSVGGGDDEDIYFEDSHIKMYDAVSGYYKRIAWYSVDASINFAKLHYWDYGTDAAGFSLYIPNYGFAILQGASDCSLGTNAALLKINVGVTYAFNLHETGTLQMPSLTSAPTAHNGDCAFKSGTDVPVRWYASNDSSWHRWTFSTSGW